MIFKRTLKRNNDFKRVYQKGKFAFANPFVVVYSVKSKKAIPGIGITASKKIGNAVLRNRARRVIREALRPYCDSLNSHQDIVIVARSAAGKVKMQTLQKALVKALKKIGALE